MLRKRNKYRIASMFSGCGGMDLGFIGGFKFNEKSYDTHPFEIAWANELNPYACRSYRRNLAHDVKEGDVWEHISSIPDDVDVIIGGFPCQDISVNNKNARGVDGERSGLYKAMVEAVHKVRPKIFVAENVKALLNKNNRDSLERVYADFSNLGYNVNYKLYNAADYEVPQTRERVLIVGTLDSEFIHPAPVVAKDDWVSVKSVIDDIADLPKDEDWSHNWSLASKSAEQGNRKLVPERPGYTMLAECHGNTHFHYRKNRRISMREGARIQSFPDEFLFLAKLRETERQIGNAVPPVLAWHVAKNVAEYLDGVQEIPSSQQMKLEVFCTAAWFTRVKGEQGNE